MFGNVALPGRTDSNGVEYRIHKMESVAEMTVNESTMFYSSKHIDREYMVLRSTHNSRVQPRRTLPIIISQM